ncbi:MAG: acyl carrier protein [Spirochaetales bacterium]|nr:acyl carrier protein [Spirochaetales bacterium]
MKDKIDWDTFHKTVCEHLGLGNNEITSQTEIYKDIGLDSLGMVSLGMRLQGMFSVTVPLSEVATIKTIGDLFEKLNEYRK